LVFNAILNFQHLAHATTPPATPDKQ